MACLFDAQEMNEDSKLLDKPDCTGFLDAGQMYMFYPQKYFTRLTLCRTRSTDEPGVYIKRKAALAVLERIGTWRYIHCSGFNGWINVSEDQKGSNIFVPAPTFRRYQNWKGNNNFLFNGKIMLGSDARSFIFTNFMIALVSFLFFWHIAPAAPHSKLITAIGAVLISSTVYNLWLTAFVEPGIVPRQPLHIKPRQADPQTEAGWRHCTICNILRAPEVKHCSVCQNCVIGFDHHCPYTSNCIGARNRVHFVRFVLAVTAAVLFILGVGVTILTLSVLEQDSGNHVRDLALAVVQHGVVAVVTLVALLSLFMFLPFCYYHLYIVAVGETTFQRIKHIYASAVNPNNRGVCANYTQLCCGAAPESLVPDLTEEITYKRFLRENLEPAKFEALLYGGRIAGGCGLGSGEGSEAGLGKYGSVFQEVTTSTSLAGTEVV